MSTESGLDSADLERILGHLPDLVLVLDLEGRIRYLNRAEPGYGPQDFVGRNANELMPEESEAAYAEALRALRETGEPQRYDAKVELDDGFEGWYRTRMSLTEGSDGGPRLLLVSQNVTAEKEAEAEAARLRKLLPLCAWCDRIRDDAGEWFTLQEYASKREGATVSHGICPRCSEAELEGENGNGDTNGNVA